MDPADQDQEPGPAQVRAAVAAGPARCKHQGSDFRLSSRTGGRTPPRDIHSAPLEPFSGQPHLCRCFLFHFGLQFQLRPVPFTTDIAKIQYILGLLRGKALTWAEARFAKEGTLEGGSYHEFLEEFKLVFDCPSARFCASSSLLRLSQGRRSVEEYTLEFRMLAVEVDWTQVSLRAACTSTG
ncbi:hypothetical protein L3Q82_022722 [Scortum barcoo]|uniref:Uncharacterized protein n=1 Tax=Scortum barcoo TaxID=214431 RepID=A0ACB8WYD4_9TELE|nr:hypothetical protein L3Q82_022722 [Scortum barcoo]